MNRTKSALPSRERRVWKTVWGMLVAALSISAIVLMLSILRSRAQGDTFDFLSGMTTGLLFGLPFGMAFFLYRAYRQMDEFGQRLQERACGLAFVMTMLAALAGYVFVSRASLNVPLWALYLFGMAAYTTSWPERTPMRTPGRCRVRGSLAARGGRE